MCLLRAHFLQGALSEEELAQLGGQDVATLSHTTRWGIHNISGVCGALWAQEGTVHARGGDLSGYRLPGPGSSRDAMGVPLPCPELGSQGVPGTLFLLCQK